MSHFKISTSERWNPTACLSWKEGSVKAASVLARPRSVCQPEQLVGEFHSQAATAFSSGLRYRLITDADAGGDEEAQAGLEMSRVAGSRVIVSRRPHLFRAVTRHRRLHGQQLHLQPKNVGHPPGRVLEREESQRELIVQRRQMHQGVTHSAEQVENRTWTKNKNRNL